MSGYWQIVTPWAGKNFIPNPSFERDLDGWYNPGGTITRSSAHVRRGGWACKLQGVSGVLQYTTLSLTAGTYTVSFDMYRAAGESVALRWLRITQLLESTTFVAQGMWARVNATFIADVDGDYRIEIALPGNWTVPLWVDGVQVEAESFATTYMDGDQDGCQWLGVPHASESRRLATARAGGRIYNLTDLGMAIGAEPGAGMPPVRIVSSPAGGLDGEIYEQTLALPRHLTLTPALEAQSRLGRHDIRRKLVNLLKPDAAGFPAPFPVRYIGAGDVKQAAFVYDRGAEMGPAIALYSEQPGVQLVAHRPFWVGDGNQAAGLTPMATSTTRYLAARLDYAWEYGALTPASIAGTTPDVQAVLHDRLGNLYVGGNFTDWDGLAGADYLATFPANGAAWAAVGTAGLNGQVRDLALGPDGLVYFCGAFISVNGQPGYHIASYDPVTGAFAAHSLYQGAMARKLAVTGDGVVWAAYDSEVEAIVGATGTTTFTDAVGGTGGIGTYALATGPNNSLFVGGNFEGWTAINPDFSPRIMGLYDGSWRSMGQGFASGIVYAIYAAPNGDVYAGGSIPGYLQRFNGTTWQELGLDLDGAVYAIAATAGGTLLIGGNFTTVGGLDTPGIAELVPGRWGVSVHPLDIVLPAAVTVKAIHVYGDDIYLGFDKTGAVSHSTTTAVRNATMVVNPTTGVGEESVESVARAYPWLRFRREGGTSATIKSVANETTGARVRFEYDLLPGEEAILDLRPGRRRMISDRRGQVWDTLPGSDVGEFFLMPGDNTLSCLVTGDATVSVNVMWQETFWSAD